MEGGVMVYFIAAVYIDEEKGRGDYDEYIREVRPIVEQYGGRYIVRSDKITPLGEKWRPGRLIVIEWDTKEHLDKCFRSGEYRKIASKREGSVDSRAVIVEG